MVHAYFGLAQHWHASCSSASQCSAVATRTSMACCCSSFASTCRCCSSCSSRTALSSAACRWCSCSICTASSSACPCRAFFSLQQVAHRHGTAFSSIGGMPTQSFEATATTAGCTAAPPACPLIALDGCHLPFMHAACPCGLVQLLPHRCLSPVQLGAQLCLTLRRRLPGGPHQS